MSVSHNPADYPRNIQLLIEAIARVYEGGDTGKVWERYFEIAEKNAQEDASNEASATVPPTRARLLLRATRHQ